MISSFTRSAAALAVAVLLSVVVVPGASAGTTFCGDGTCDFDENCDNCAEDCPGCCGNGELEDGEGCDDGNIFISDGCNTFCLIENDFDCGSPGIGLAGDESCESGVCDETQSANGVCEPANLCGNGTLEGGEGCDDGGDASLDGCDSSCLVEDGSPCNGDDGGQTGDSSCASGICDESEEPTATCQAPNECGNTVCEAGNDEDCSICEADCGACPITTSTTMTTSTTIPPSTTTSTTSTSSSTTMPVTGACCVFGSCQTVAEDYCLIELLGVYAGDDTSCEDPGVCSTCGNNCIEFGETCDDGDTQNGDGCNDGCQEEECWICTDGASLTGDSLEPVACPGGGPSFCEEDPLCTICGDGVVEGDEQCDPGKDLNPCCDDCEFVAAQTSCANDFFCDGAETCDGSGNCNDAPDPTCDELDSSCAEGYCDQQLDACASETQSKEGNPCQASGECITGAGGTCEDGTCVGAPSVLSPTCRWIILSGTSDINDDDVRVHTGPGSTVDADMCGDTARIGGITTDDIVAMEATGEGIRFYGPPVVHGDIVTGKSTVRANLYLNIPGTFVKSVDTGMTEPKLPSGVVSTTGAHPLVGVCADDRVILEDAATTLENMSSGSTEGLKVGVGGGFTLDRTGQGVAVVDLAQLKVSHGATLTLKGNASDVIVLRVTGGRVKLGYGARVVLDGLVPGNVLIYSDGSRCRVSPGVVGAGTLFCPNSGRVVVGAGVQWSGTFLGAAREMRVRKNAALTHVPFTGF